MAEDFSYEIKKNIGVISESSGGWKMELNTVSWGGRPEKYDIRSWSPDHQRMGKGCTFSAEELKTLKDLLNSISDV